MIQVGLGVTVGAAPATGGAPAPPTNLLLWTEQFDNAIWVHAGICTVTPDAAANPNPPGDGSTTADLLVGTAGTGLTQDVLAASTGSTVTTVPLLSDSFTRLLISGTFDSVVYTLSLYAARAAAVSTRLKVQMAIAGGNLQAQFLWLTPGSGAYIWGAQLEIAASASPYQARTT